MNRLLSWRSSLDTTIPTHLSPIRIVLSDLQKKFIVSVLQKCIIGVRHGTTFDYGPIFGSIGTNPKQWKLWARSVNEKEIPVLKTTMIVESHWRKLKHDYLHRFNRPRIDLVICVLLSRLIPSAITRMHSL